MVKNTTTAKTNTTSTKVSSPKIWMDGKRPRSIWGRSPQKNLYRFPLTRPQQPGKLTFWHGDLIHFIWVTFWASSRYFFWMPVMKGVLSRDPETPREVVWTALNVENEAGLPRTSPNLPRCFGRAYSKSSKPFGNIQPTQSGETRAWTISPPIFLLPIFTLPETKTCSAPSKMDDWKTMKFPFLLGALKGQAYFQCEFQWIFFRICTHKKLPLIFFPAAQSIRSFSLKPQVLELCMPTSLHPVLSICLSLLQFLHLENEKESIFFWRKFQPRPNPWSVLLMEEIVQKSSDHQVEVG